MDIVNEVLVILVASGATLLGLFLIQPLRPDMNPVTWLRWLAAGWLWAYAFVILFLQFLRPRFAQTIALVGMVGVFWLLDGILYQIQTERRTTDANT